MLPKEIDELLKRDVIGQEEVLRYVSVAIFKHLQGERFGNLMMIGSSGTGKTTVMRAMERMYQEHPEFSKYRVVVILNANTFATDEGVVDTSQLFRTLEERARQVLGENLWLPIQGDNYRADSVTLHRPQIDLDPSGLEQRKRVNENWADILYHGASEKRAY